MVLTERAKARMFGSWHFLIGQRGEKHAQLLLVSGGDPTPDKPGVVFRPPADASLVSHAMTLRVADCRAVYAALRSRG